MIDNLHIRQSKLSDVDSVEALYLDAFPDEDLFPLVRDLMGQETIVLSRVGIDRSILVAHVAFTKCSVDECDAEVALLGPLAVASALQKGGIGSAMVRDGFQRLKADGFAVVYVLGDPRYYGRLGFVPERRVSPPYPLPAEWKGAWQSINLGNHASTCQGTLSVPQPWHHRALWET